MRLEISFDGSSPDVARLKGGISETFDPQPLVDRLAQGQPIVIDLSEVSRINSTGVREWLHFIRNVDTSKLTFVNISPAMVQQIAMVANILPVDRIESLALPFLCDECDHEHTMYVKTAEALETAEKPRVCPNCDTADALVFDDLVEVYLGWVKSE